MKWIKKKPILAYMLFSYVFTILTITISTVYTVNGFHLVDKHMEWALFNNTINIGAIFMCWFGVCIFLCTSVLITYVWIKEEK